MRARAIAGGLLVVLMGLGVILPGCSGGGRAFQSDTALNAFVADQATAALFAKRWLRILYPAAPTEAPQCDPDVGQLEPVPEGYIWRFRNSDCSEGDYLLRSDGSGEGTVTYPDGTRMTEKWDAPTSVGPDEQIQHNELTYRDGAQQKLTGWVNYATNASSEEGTFTLPPPQRGTLAYSWSLDYYVNGLRTLELKPKDKSRLTMQIREGNDVEQGPAENVPVQGTYHDPQGRALEFSLTRAPGLPLTWNQWHATTPAGLEATCRLGNQFVAYGEVREAGEALGLLSWTKDGAASLIQTGGGELTGQPSAAALDFIVDQWVQRLGQYGPNPR